MTTAEMFYLKLDILERLKGFPVSVHGRGCVLVVRAREMPPTEPTSILQACAEALCATAFEVEPLTRGQATCPKHSYQIPTVAS